MKHLLTLLLSVFIFEAAIQAQAPQLLNYQGVARNGFGNALPNRQMTLRLSIRNGSSSGTVVYSETRTVTTNGGGLYSVQIGSTGTSATTGSLATINWQVGTKFLQVEVDPDAGTNFVDLGTTQLVSVPYAMSAGVATPGGSAGGDLSGTYPNPSVANSAINTIKLADAAVTTLKLADQSVTTSKLADYSVTSAKLADLSITSGKLVDASVTTAKIADANVTTSKLADASVTDAKIVTVSGSKVTGNIAGSAANVTGTVAVANGGTGATTAAAARTNLGLGNVDNTSDLNKPISTATQAALDLKENLTNKSTATTLGTSDVLYPTQNAVKSYVDGQIVSNTTPDATTTVKGKVQLAGDLTGTAASPAVAAAAITTAKLADASVTDAKIVTVSGSKVTGNISGNAGTVTNGVYTVGDQTIAGVKTFSSTIVGSVSGNASTVTTNANLTGPVTSVGNATAIADGALSIAKTTGLQTELDAKESLSNKSTATNLGTSDVLYPTQNAVKSYVDGQIVASSTPDATTTVKGKVQLAGDLTGTAASPAVAAAAITTAKLADASVTDAKIVTVAGSKVTGNISGNAGTVTNGVYTVGDQTIAGVKTFASTIIGSVSGNAATVTTNANLTGPVTSVGNATAIANGAITNAMLANSAVANLSGTNTGDQTTITGNAGTVTNGVYTVGDQTIAGVKTFSSTIVGSVSGNAANVTGTVAIANGGTGATTAAGARTNLGGTTVGGNFFTLSNPSAITFPRVNADNTISALSASDFRAAIGAASSSTSGTVTSVAALTLGTTGTDLSSSVANGSTTPVITLNVPDASATARGVITTGTQTFAGAKTFSSDITVNGVKIGRGAGNNDQNVAVGADALASGTGTRNTAIGYGAMRQYSGTSFDNNTSVGYFNMPSLTTGNGNTSVGAEAMLSITTGTQNTSIGNQSLINTTGNNNVGVGKSAGQTITTGSGNTILGTDADVAANNLSNATALGYGATVAASNTIQLGNTSVSNVKTSGTITADAVTYPKAHGTSGQVLSTTGSGALTWITPSTTATAYSGTLPVANGGTGLTSITSGQIPFGNGNSAIGTSSNLTWDNSTGSLGIGTSTPGNGFNTKLDVVGSTSFRTNSSDIGLKFDGYSPSGTLQVSRIYTDATSGTPGDFILGTYPNGHLNQLYMKQSNGFVGIRTSSPTTALDVNGTVTATSLVKSGGTSSQFLMADGTATSSPSLSSATGLPLTTGITGTLPIANGGTGGTTAAGARTNLGATTVGDNFFILTNPSAVTFPRINADNTISALTASDFRSAIGAGTSSTSGTVTSIGLSAGTTGSDVNISGSPITSSGTITLNIPDASSSARGVVTTGSQTFAGGKTFTNNINVNNLSIGSPGGSQNTMFGNASFGYSSPGSNNTGLGFFTLASLSGGNDNTAVGTNAIRQGGAANGSRNTAVGSAALTNGGASNDNVAVGSYAMPASVTGSSNVALGSSALYSTTSASYNVGVGYEALKNTTTGGSNTAIGRGAMLSNTTGDVNTAVGENALVTNTSGRYNTSIGVQAQEQNTTGGQNTAIGVAAIDQNKLGNNNAVLGAFAGRHFGANYVFLTDITTRIDNSVLVGYDARPLANNSSNEIVIGYNAVGNGSNTAQIGNSSITNVKTSGTLTAGAITYPNTAGTNGYYLKTDGSGTASWAAVTNGTVTSLGLSTGTSGSDVNVSGSPITSSGTITLNIPDASATARGLVTTGSQVFSGNKDFRSPLRINWNGAGETGTGGALQITGDNSTYKPWLSIVNYGNSAFNLGADEDAAIIGFDDNAQNLDFRSGITWNSFPSSGTVRMRITSAGNVGIGTTSPQARLDVAAATRTDNPSSSDLSFYVSGDMSTGQTGTSAKNIEFRHSNATQGIGFGYNTIYQTGTNTNQELNILSRGNSPITLNAYPYSTGNVGIGTNSPSNKLDVVGNLGINTSGQTRVFSTFYGAGSDGNNIFIGGGGLSSGTGGISSANGSYNTSIGVSALNSNTTGYTNTAMGISSLAYNTTGYQNTAVGGWSLFSNTDGYHNTSMGQSTMYYNTTGYQNTALGRLALHVNTTGYQNTAVGNDAGLYTNAGGTNETSNTSVYVGHDARASANGNSNEIVIGASARGNGSNSVTLGSSSITKSLLRGKVGIGTTSPTTALHIENSNSMSGDPGSNGVPSIYLYNSSNSSTTAHSIMALRSAGSSGGNPYMSYDINGVTGYSIGIDNSDADKLKFQSNWDFNNSDIPVMTFTTDDKAGIGTASPSYKLDVNSSDATTVRISSTTTDNNGLLVLNANSSDVNAWNAGNHEFIYFQKQGTNIGSIKNNGENAVTYNTSSDYRLKEDYQSFSGLSLVSKMKVYDHAWKSDKSRMYGFKAHELQSVVPYLVSGKKDEVGSDGKPMYQMVDYSKLTPVLVKALQEQQEEIDSLKKKQADLEARLLRLEEKLK